MILQSGKYISWDLVKTQNWNCGQCVAGADADDVGGVVLQSLLIIICLPPCLYPNLPLGVVHHKFQHELTQIELHT